MTDAAPPADVWTVQRLLTWTAGWLGQAGSPSGRRDGELLLAHVLGCNRLQLLLRFDQPVQKDELAAYKALIRRRARREPVAYILGLKGFHDIEVAVDRSVLVPRPETEVLVDFAAAYLHSPGAAEGAVLDLCTGSGCIALALCRDLEKLGLAREFWATDVSDAALAVARSNSERLGRSVQWRSGDLWAALPSGLRFAAIVSNPPYIPSAALAGLDPDVREWEPHAALDGGADGLDVARRIAAGASFHLVPGGFLAIEVGSRSQAEATAADLGARGFAHLHTPVVPPGPIHLVIGHWPGPAAD